MFNKKTIRDVDLRGKTVLVRADYNVPIEYLENGDARILSNFRVRASLPTLRFLIGAGVKKIVLISHLGRPESFNNLSEFARAERLENGDLKFSMKPVFDELRILLAAEMGRNLLMNFHPVPIFPETKFFTSLKESPDNYKIEMLENLRFFKGEKKNSPEFAQKLLEITGADLFVQDGFGVIHREHTSTSAITQILPSVAGLLLEREVSTIFKALQNPSRPLSVVMGGAKISDKLPLVENFIDKSDNLILGGALANTFLDFYNFEVGKSKIEAEQDQVILQVESRAHAKFGEEFRKKFILPTEFGVSKEFSKTVLRRPANLNQIQKDDIILDIGEDYAKYCAKILKNSKTIIWNGTLGVSELDNFSVGSEIIAEAISEATRNGATSIIGGGDTSAFALKYLEENPEVGKFSLISTGGGAALELMSGKNLPGLDALQDK